jgi:hypothetical protein
VQRSLQVLYSFMNLILLWAENFYTTWRLHGILKVFCNMHNNIYNENWRISAAWQQFSVRGSISVTARPCTRAAYRERYLALTAHAPQHKTFVWNQSLMRTLYLQAKVVFCLYLAFHCWDVTVTSLLALTAYELQRVQVWLNSVNNEGHFIWRPK